MMKFAKLRHVASRPEVTSGEFFSLNILCKKITNVSKLRKVKNSHWFLSNMQKTVEI